MKFPTELEAAVVVVVVLVALVLFLVVAKIEVFEIASDERKTAMLDAAASAAGMIRVAVVVVLDLGEIAVVVDVV